MIIFIKTEKTGTPLDIECSATLRELYKKSEERIGRKGQLVFAGKVLTPSTETLADLKIGKEATIHFMKPKNIQIIAEYQGITKNISLPPNDSITIRDLKREIRNVFPEEEFGRELPSVSHNGTTLHNSTLLRSALANRDTVVVSKCIATASVTPTPQSNHIDEEKKEEILANFVSSSSSSNVEIVFCFDTTGSMSSCIAQVRSKLIETMNRLLKDIPNLKIGIIAHGDFCDSHSTYVIKHCDLTANSSELKTFVDAATGTGGGDAPEAYELALQVAAKEMSWTPGFAKALVMIGDEVPHPPSYTTENINWFDELDDLHSKGVKVYGVRALNSSHAIPFYEEMAERTGGISIHFSSFHLIVDMFLAICYRESCQGQFQEFEEEMKNEGKMNEEMKEIFDNLQQPNCIVNEVKKEKKSYRSTQLWYDIDRDCGSPQYTRSGAHWNKISFSRVTNAPSHRGYHSTVKSVTSDGRAKVVVVGDGAVGKTSLLITCSTNEFPSCYVPSVFDNYSHSVAYDGKTYSIGLWDTAGQEDYDRLRPLSYPGTDIFMVCFSVDSPASFRNRRKWVEEIHHHCPGIPFYYVITKSDLRSNTEVKERLHNKGLDFISHAEIRDAAKADGAVGSVECSSLEQTNLDVVFEQVINSTFKTAPKRKRSLFTRLIYSLGL